MVHPLILALSALPLTGTGPAPQVASPAPTPIVLSSTATADGLQLQLQLGGQPVTAELTAAPVRGSGYQLLVDAGDGALTGLPTGDGAAFVGTSADGRWRIVAGTDGDDVLVSARNLTSTIATAAGLQSATSLGTGAGAPPATLLAAAGDGDLTVVDLAIDVDFEGYLSDGSNLAATELRVLTTLALMNDEHWNDPFENTDPEVFNRLTALVVRTNPADPYTSNSPSGRLAQLQNVWNTSLEFVPRDVAQLWTGANLSGSVIGLSFLDTLCTATAYGLASQDAANLAEQAARNSRQLAFSWGVPLCSTEPGCNLMCSGFCSGDNTGFGPSSLAVFEAQKPGFDCLDVLPTHPALSAPNVTGVTPALVPAVVADAAVVTLTGSGFQGTESVTVGAEGLSFTDGEFRALDDQTLELRLPEQPNLGPVSVAVANALGSTTTSFVVQPNVAPAIDLEQSTPEVLSTADTARVLVGAPIGDVVILAASFSDVPSILPGLVALDIGNGFTQLNQLGVFTVPAATGFVEFTAPAAALPPGAEFFLQAATLSGTAPTLPAEVTGVQSGIRL